MPTAVGTQVAAAGRGRRRYTLWTGDAGLALYLWHCVDGAGGVPSLDVLD